MLAAERNDAAAHVWVCCVQPCSVRNQRSGALAVLATTERLSTLQCMQTTDMCSWAARDAPVHVQPMLLLSIWRRYSVGRLVCAAAKRVTLQRITV